MKWNTPLVLVALLLCISSGTVLAQSSSPIFYEGSSLEVTELDAQSGASLEVENISALRFPAALNYNVQHNGLDTIVRITNIDGTVHSIVLSNMSGISVERIGDWNRLVPTQEDPTTPYEECCTCQSFQNFSDDFETGGCVPGCMGCGCEACVCTPGPCGGGSGGSSIFGIARDVSVHFQYTGGR